MILNKIHTNTFKLMKYLPEVSVDSRFSSIMLGKCLVSLEKCSVLLEKFFKTYARDRSVIARNFLVLEMLDHFSIKDSLSRHVKKCHPELRSTDYSNSQNSLEATSPETKEDNATFQRGSWIVKLERINVSQHI